MPKLTVFSMIVSKLVDVSAFNSMEIDLVCGDGMLMTTLYDGDAWSIGGDYQAPGTVLQTIYYGKRVVVSDDEVNSTLEFDILCLETIDAMKTKRGTI